VGSREGTRRVHGAALVVRVGDREGTCHAHVGFAAAAAAAAAAGCPFREACVGVRVDGMFVQHSEKRNC
jgi:hypothetical protein